MQLNLFEQQVSKVPPRQLLYDLFKAYYDARKNKRNTKSALSFEQNYEHHLFQLYNEIINRKYEIKPSICFINYSPVQREIFAAHFRDRVVHHLVYNYISPIFERVFINDSYSCRKGKGTSYGIKRINRFIRSCSNNYKTDCYILRLDIKGYFMAINRDLLYKKTINTLEKYRFREYTDQNGKKHEWNRSFNYDKVQYLLQKIIYNNPVENYIIKGSQNDWQGLPASKSLFHSEKGCGLPIGNLTSQLFSNIYLNDFDHWITHQKKCRYYGRYVDDFIIIHSNKDYLKSIVPEIREYLKTELKLELHPKKIYLQHFTKGVKFLGAVIKPHRLYIANRTKGNFYKALSKQNNIIKNQIPEKPDIENFQSSVNSYLGILKHYRTHNLIKKIIFTKMDKEWWRYVYLSGYNKFVMKTLK